MRALEEIEKEIKELKPEFDEVCVKMEKLKMERGDFFFYKFCEKYGVKKGDIIQLKNGLPVQVIGHPAFDGDVIKVRFTNCETVEVAESLVGIEGFEGCKVIGHIDID